MKTYEAPNAELVLFNGVRVSADNPTPQPEPSQPEPPHPNAYPW